MWAYTHYILMATTLSSGTVMSALTNQPLNTAAISVVPYGAFGEEVAVLSDDLLHKLIGLQAPEAVKAYGKQAGADDRDVLYLRVDFQCEKGNTSDMHHKQ